MTILISLRLNLAEVNDQLAREAKLDELEPWQTSICVVFDEVKIKEGLVYDKHSGNIIGFNDLGDVNVAIDRIEEVVHKSEKISSSMLVFMVRGHLNFPYAQFPCQNLNAGVLYPIVWDVVRNLELTGFQVLAMTADGVSFNRNFFQIHRDSRKNLVHKVKNRYADEDRYIFFFSDVPHLLKTARNCLANSFAHQKTRQLWVCNINFHNTCM